MSHENVELLRAEFRRWADGGFAPGSGSVELYDPQVEWDLSAFPLVDLPTTGRGRGNLFRTWVEYGAGWRDYRAEAVEFVDAGEDVVVVMHETARIGESDVVVERDIPHIFTLRDGRVVMWRVFRTKSDALEAAGLSE